MTEPFFTTKAVGKGTGLGLSMVYGFAQQSGGTIRIESQVGDGTSVEIWLPRAPEVLDQPAPDAIAGAAERLSMQRPRNILLVDDHEGVRATTAALLEDLGHRVTTAADGVQVTNLLRSGLGDIDLVISDYAMPLMSGSEVIRKLRVARPACRRSSSPATPKPMRYRVRRRAW